VTTQELKDRKAKLERNRDALVDAIAEVDTQSASISAGGGSKSFTNRSVDDLKRKIAFIDKEIARIDARLGLRCAPGRIVVNHTEFYE
jgi:uncharacterized small protein (DUF1192 family)